MRSGAFGEQTTQRQGSYESPKAGKESGLGLGRPHWLALARPSEHTSDQQNMFESAIYMYYSTRVYIYMYYLLSLHILKISRA